MADPPGSNQASSPDESPDIKQEVRGDRNQVIGQAINSTVVSVSGGTVNLPAPPSPELDTSKQTPNNLPRSGAIAFFGRDQKLQELHHHLQSSDRMAITAIQGMGGIGKTELALQYAIAAYNQELYPGGVCWLRSRDQEIATQIVSFAKANLGLFIPDDMEAAEQTTFIWQRWPEGKTLIVIDDVTDYDVVASYLPPSVPRFKVLITTRQNFGASVTSINIEELSDEDAIALLKSIVGDKRIEVQRSDAEKLCEWVGNLPLGLELSGRFMVRKPDWAIAKLLKRLESKRLTAKALVSSESGMTASLGVAAALELSWTELDDKEKDLACLVGMFAVSPIPWQMVEQCFKDVDADDLEDWRDHGLLEHSLIKRVNTNQYQLHQVVQEFFREKLKNMPTVEKIIKSKYCRSILKAAQNLTGVPLLHSFSELKDLVPHVEEAASEYLYLIDENDRFQILIGLGNFYERLGNYKLAKSNYKKCLDSSMNLFGKTHYTVATSLNNLGRISQNQAQYEDAESLLLDALYLKKKIYGYDHPQIATTLNDLANLYKNLDRYEQAESLYKEAILIRKKLFENDPLDVTITLSDLANLYDIQGNYAEAETLYKEALKIRKKNLKTYEDSEIANIINNLARLYNYQGDYIKAEKLYKQALFIREKIFIDMHPDISTSLNDLATFYDYQGSFEKAEVLYKKAFEMNMNLFGEKHPDVATNLNNLALLYFNQKKFKKSEQLHLRALKIRKEIFGESHLDTASSLNNLGLIYASQKRASLAEFNYKKALEIKLNILNTEIHPDIASSLNNLAVLYDNEGQYDNAKSLYEKAIYIRKKIFGNEHPDVAQVLFNLGTLYEQKGNTQDARSNYLEALKIVNKDFDSSHILKEELLKRLASTDKNSRSDYPQSFD